MSYSCYDCNRQVKTQVYDNGRSMTLGEITDILNAIEKLSPATRRLLIERPEAVDACVEAVKSTARREEHRSQCECDEDDCDTCDDLWDEMCEHEQKALDAIRGDAT